MLKLEQTVNADIYCENLDGVNQSYIEKFLATVNQKGVILQYNNARDFIEQNKPRKKLFQTLKIWRADGQT